eukprot:7389472-Prymnesium_polylepis.1
MGRGREGYVVEASAHVLQSDTCTRMLPLHRRCRSLLRLRRADQISTEPPAITSTGQLMVYRDSLDITSGERHAMRLANNCARVAQ